MNVFTDRNKAMFLYSCYVLEYLIFFCSLDALVQNFAAKFDVYHKCSVEVLSRSPSE